MSKDERYTRYEVYGHSDDLVYARCPNEDFAEELGYPYGDGPHEYHVSGVLFYAEYDGEWSFDVWDVFKGTHFTKYAVGTGPAEQKNEYTQLMVIASSEEDPFAYRVE